MSADDVAPRLDGKMYLAMGRELAERIDGEIGHRFEAQGFFGPDDAVTILVQEFGGDGNAPSDPERQTDFEIVKESLLTLLKRTGMPTSPESQELLEADAAQDAANLDTGITTRLIELEYRRDSTMDARAQAQWQADYNKIQSEISVLPEARARAIRQEAQKALADRDAQL